MNTATLVHEVLDEYGGLSHRALMRYLEDAAERDDVYRLAAAYPSRRGRSLRSSLCIAAARAFGAPAEAALLSAVSLELLHNAFLIHDDIEDESEERRGAPALHQLCGIASALNAGDALIALGLRPLIGNRALLGPQLAWQIFEEADRMVRESVEGQAMELRWRRDTTTHLTDQDYLKLVLKKTCWYTMIYPIRVGALIGTRGECRLERFTRFGFFLGAAFQIQDDLLNLVGDHTKYGKELAGDLLEGKRTLLLIYALQGASASDAARAQRFLELPRAQKPEAELRWLSEMIVHCGALKQAREVAHALAGAAAHEFSIAFQALPETRDLAFLRALPQWVLERT